MFWFSRPLKMWLLKTGDPLTLLKYEYIHLHAHMQAHTQTHLHACTDYYVEPYFGLFLLYLMQGSGCGAFLSLTSQSS